MLCTALKMNKLSRNHQVDEMLLFNKRFVLSENLKFLLGVFKHLG